MIIVGHINYGDSVQGRITGVNIYSGTFMQSDLNLCTGGHGDVVSWLEFDECVKADLTSFQRPSTCPYSSGNQVIHCFVNLVFYVSSVIHIIAQSCGTLNHAHLSFIIFYFNKDFLFHMLYMHSQKKTFQASIHTQFNLLKDEYGQMDVISQEETSDFCCFVVVTDNIPPVVEYCPDNVIKALYDGSLRTKISWLDPKFTDNIGIIRELKTHSPGTVTFTLQPEYM